MKGNLSERASEQSEHIDVEQISVQDMDSV